MIIKGLLFYAIITFTSFALLFALITKLVGSLIVALLVYLFCAAHWMLLNDFAIVFLDYLTSGVRRD